MRRRQRSANTAFALAQRVTRNDASNVQLGCSLRSELKLDVVGRDVQPTLEKPCNPSRANPAAGLFISELALTPGSGPEPQAARVRGFALAAWPSCSGPRQPAVKELGGGPVHHVRLTELERLAGPSAPCSATPHVGLDLIRALRSVPSNVTVRAHPPGVGCPTSVALFSCSKLVLISRSVHGFVQIAFSTLF